MTKCPCEECICIPICRHKHYYTLVTSCHLVKTELFYRENVDNAFRHRCFSRAIVDIEKCLKPVLWHINVKNSGYAVIRKRSQ